MTVPFAADLCALMALGSLAAFWQQDRAEPLCRDLLIALAGVALVLALF
ncbi:hypothetical protein [Rhodovulum marinum]|uniref:Uncharacterized protein n=1 Tax=Rhodovulum marinum TaxID=320662 RepID=A0A4R2Q177_9RHOB|nr:hypothetical protein [Rhodovulum marinum]TCP42119.1 hypothetical protein EV662_10324 [Rhodovulum marinum]